MNPKIKFVTILLVVCMVVTSAGILHANSSYDCLFNGLEATYPNFFAPAGGQSLTAGTYYYRYYSQTNSYIAIESTGGNLLYLGPGTSSLINLGPVSDWLMLNGCGTNTGSGNDIQPLVDKVLGLSTTIQGDVTKQLTPVLEALGATGSICPTVATNLGLSNISNLAGFLANFPNPANLALDYGTGCTTKTGDLMSGKMGFVVTDFILGAATGGLNANFALTVDNLMTNGQLMSNGQMNGNINMVLTGSPSGSGSLQFINFLVDGDMVVNGSLNLAVQSSSNMTLKMNLADGQGLQVNLDMLIQKTSDDNYQISTPVAGTVNQYTVMMNNLIFNQSACPKYPIAGSIVFSQGVKNWTITFDDSCNDNIVVIP